MGRVIIQPHTTKNPITLIGEEAGICYGTDTTDPVKNYKRGKRCIEDGLGRVLEFPQVYMILDGYSARVMRENNDISEEILPMGMRCQAHEIIRTWAFYSIVKSLYHTGQIPWKDIMISGFVLAKPGEKISKSKSNDSNSPINLIETHSADAIRYWAANSKLGTDTFFSEDELKISKRFINKLYNASKFAIMQLNDFKKPESYNESMLLPVDRWIMQRVNETTIKVTSMLNNYEIGQARHEIDNLFWRDFCDYYIEIAKERLYQPLIHGTEQRYSGQIAVYYGLLGILKLYAIYTPYVTEYIYQKFYRKYEKEISLHETLWETSETDEVYIEFGEHLKEVIAEVRKSKTERKMSMKDSIPELIITCPKKYRDFHGKQTHHQRDSPA